MEQPKAPWRSGICQNKVSTPTLPEGPERYGSNLILPQISQTAEKDSIREQKSGAQFNRSRSRDSSTVPLPASSIAALLQSAMSCGAAHRTIPAEDVSRAKRAFSVCMCEIRSPFRFSPQLYQLLLWPSTFICNKAMGYTPII